MAQYGAQPDQQLFINPTDEEPRLVIRFRGKDPVTGKPAWAYPQPPLNFSASHARNGAELAQEDFSVGIQALLATSSAKDMLEYLRERANMRNKLLYATEQGYYDIQLQFEKMFDLYRDNTFLILRTLLLIDPYPKKQLFVQQAIDAFVKHLKAIPKSEL